MSWKEKNRPENVPLPENSARSARIASFVRAPRSRTAHADRLEVLLPLAAYADAEDHPAT